MRNLFTVFTEKYCKDICRFISLPNSPIEQQNNGVLYALTHILQSTWVIYKKIIVNKHMICLLQL